MLFGASIMHEKTSCRENFVYIRTVVDIVVVVAVGVIVVFAVF